MDPTTKLSRQKVYDATIAPHNTGDSGQVSAANAHSGQNWRALSDHNFIAAHEFIAAASS